MTDRRRLALLIVAVPLVIATLLVTANAAFKWNVYRMLYARHAPGVHFFETFTGPWQPYRPLDEITFEEARSRGTYCIGVYDEEGRLSVLERYVAGRLFFRYEYGYQRDGWLGELRGGHVGRPPRTWRAGQ